MAGETHRTTDAQQVRQWAEQRGGKPTKVKGTGDDKDAGLLRIDFPGYSGEDDLEQITWDEFTRKFRESRLAFVYQETTQSGERSNFNKLVSQDEA